VAQETASANDLLGPRHFFRCRRQRRQSQAGQQAEHQYGFAIQLDTPFIGRERLFIIK
jgi:hypothetical protein